jgi:PmbA protein
MIVNRLIEEAMKKARGAQASLGQTESISVSFENDKLKSVRSSQDTGMSVRLIVDGKIGSSHTTDIEDVHGVVGRALEAGKFGSPAHFTFPGVGEGKDVKVYDEAVPPVTKEEMIWIGEEMITQVKEYNPDVLVSAGVSKSVSKNQFANSAGIELATEETGFSVWVHGQWVRGTDILLAGHDFGWKRRQIDHVGIARKAIELFKMAEHIAPLRSGDMPVIFTPEGVNVLLLALRLGLNGERFSLSDNPLLDYGGGSSKYDGEGVPHQVTPLIEGGVVKNFLYDLDTAGRAGTRTTGNGVGCSPTNLVIKEADRPYEEMVKDTREGLLVHSVLGLGQGNPISGEFSVNVQLGYKIENGEIVGRVKDVMLAGNTYEALKTIAAVGAKAEWVGGLLLTPPIAVARLSVVAK